VLRPFSSELFLFRNIDTKQARNDTYESVSERVLSETPFTLQGHYRTLLPQIKDLLSIAALDLFVRHDIYFVYAFNAAYMQVHSTTAVCVVGN
jgi:hypothetical protein